MSEEVFASGREEGKKSGMEADLGRYQAITLFWKSV